MGTSCRNKQHHHEWVSQVVWNKRDFGAARKPKKEKQTSLHWKSACPRNQLAFRHFLLQVFPAKDLLLFVNMWFLCWLHGGEASNTDEQKWFGHIVQWLSPASAKGSEMVSLSRMKVSHEAGWNLGRISAMCGSWRRGSLVHRPGGGRKTKPEGGGLGEISGPGLPGGSGHDKTKVHSAKTHF